MAAEVVAGSVLSAFLQVIFDRIASPNVADFLRGKKSTQESLQSLKTTLYAVRAVLHDADQKQIRDSAVKNWLDDLKDAVYRADDLIDRVSTKAATQDEVRHFFGFSFDLHDRKIRYKILNIVNRLESILRHKDILGLRDSTVVGENWSWRPQSTSQVEEGVFGRDNDKEAIIKMLLSDNIDDSKTSVIPIVGMGGIGKTTLAQLAYNDDQVKQEFNLRAWVCVSEEFDVSRITRSIIESITSNVCVMKDLELLQLDLKEKLSGKKFLIVLDDIWNENYVDWELLWRHFQYGAEGSKILLTTRSEKVASIVQTLPTYRVGELSDDECWLIFEKHACLYKNSIMDSSLERIGRDIVKKCRGLPLVAKTLGGLLRLKHDIRDWNNILKSEMWDLPQEESKILPALRISYFYLSPQLKQCFLYCSMFPQDYEFKKDELILWWMAEGFLEPPMKEKTLEEVGEEYFHGLASRSFFQPSKNKVGCFVMHNLIHGLATLEARKFYSNGNEISSMTRHVFSEDREFMAIRKAKFLRTFIIKEHGLSSRCMMLPLDLLPKNKYLRVLSFRCNDNLVELPDSISKLIHLRYLNLSSSCIKKLPKTLCCLYNLQTLILSNCYALTMLPSDMQKLVNLRHLDVSNCKLNELPRGINKLKNLLFLSDFVIGKDEGANIKELGGLQNLHSSLKIKNLQHVTNDVEASEARMMDMQSIESLYLVWNVGGDIVDPEDIVDNLQPHINLKFLAMDGYRGRRFSNWLGSPLYCNITDVTLKNCKNCCLLPPLGQLPSLETLELQGFNALEKVGPEFYKNDDDHVSLTPPFPSLKFLKFSHMFGWQEWQGSCHTNAFPQLRSLTLEDCPRLSGDLPNHLPDLEALWICGCEKLASPIPRAREIYVYDCRKMEFPQRHHFESLESLIIKDACDSLTCLSLDNFPNLKNIQISGCENLKSVLNSKIPLRNLEIIRLYSCPSFASFSVEEFSAPIMTHFEVFGCRNLRSLPYHMISLPKLQSISLRLCPSIEWVPKGSFPPNLISLEIEHCVLFRMEWQSLGSLTSLTISGTYDDSVHLFPEECLLLPSLTSLSICSYSSLETLHCEGFAHLTSLQVLRIEVCPKVERITGQKLPASLTQLIIYSCSLLGEQCCTKNGEIWSKVSHIPNISVNGGRIS